MSRDVVRSRRRTASDAGSRIRLVVQADDFGMCHAVNEGVVRAFRDGILSQATVMVPCPWFPEAVALAKSERIPVGMHCTLTSEWENMRWRPLTHGASLVRRDGTFHESVQRAAAALRADEAAAELEAQVETMVASGLRPIYFDTHMGLVSKPAYRHVCERYERPFILPFVPRFLWLNSILILSPRPAAHKRRALLEYLAQLPPGTHFIQAHPGVPGEELRALAAPGSEALPWTEAYRASDLAALTDPQVLRIVAERDIELISVCEVEDSFSTSSPPGSAATRAAYTAPTG